LDKNETRERRPVKPLLRASYGIGGAALFAMVAVDFTSVAARHLGLRVLGAIEIIQICIVIAISAAILTATLEGSHAAVHLLVTRVGPRARRALERLSEILSVVLFMGLLIGGLWVAIDLWPMDERSDLLRLPFAPARFVWCLALLLCALVSLVGLFARPKLDPPADV
jgi:TRAP-type C4-dicarboxylate transport system permease small subunit